MITFRGSRQDILTHLFGFFLNYEFRQEHEILNRVQQAMEDVEAGAWLVIVRSWIFEVVEPPMTVEQDVYSCADGRACTSVPDAMRPELEAMVAARIAEGRGTDDRHLHWYWTLNHQVYQPSDVRSFVAATLGSPVVADAAHSLYSAITQATAYSDNTDVHVTLRPDRMRLRVDNEGGREWGGDPAKLPEVPGPDGKPVNIASLLTEQAMQWGVVGDGAYSVWAEFARVPGDAAELGTAYAIVPAAQIPSGAYVYRELNHLAWVRVAGIEVVQRMVRLRALDGEPMPAFVLDQPVPIFAPNASEAQLRV